jgi:hypothetical protein
MNRVVILEAKEWTTQKEYHHTNNSFHADVDALTNTIPLHYDEHTAKYEEYK